MSTTIYFLVIFSSLNMNMSSPPSFASLEACEKERVRIEKSFGKREMLKSSYVFHCMPQGGAEKHDAVGRI